MLGSWQEVHFEFRTSRPVKPGYSVSMPASCIGAHPHAGRFSRHVSSVAGHLVEVLVISSRASGTG